MLSASSASLPNQTVPCSVCVAAIQFTMDGRFVYFPHFYFVEVDSWLFRTTGARTKNVHETRANKIAVAGLSVFIHIIRFIGIGCTAGIDYSLRGVYRLY